MSKTLRPMALAFAGSALFIAACSSGTPKPLPGGPPPEYEKPRAYEGNIGEAQPAPPPPSESEAAPPPSSAPSVPAPATSAP